MGLHHAVGRVWPDVSVEIVIVLPDHGHVIPPAPVRLLVDRLLIQLHEELHLPRSALVSQGHNVVEHAYWNANQGQVGQHGLKIDHSLHRLELGHSEEKSIGRERVRGIARSIKKKGRMFFILQNQKRNTQ